MIEASIIFGLRLIHRIPAFQRERRKRAIHWREIICKQNIFLGALPCLKV